MEREGWREGVNGESFPHAKLIGEIQARKWVDWCLPALQEACFQVMEAGGRREGRFTDRGGRNGNLCNYALLFFLKDWYKCSDCRLGGGGQIQISITWRVKRE